jgi:hypothetical protein
MLIKCISTLNHCLTDFVFCIFTDSHLTTKSGFLDLLEPGDEIMADKGFPQIQESILERGGFLVMPPFNRKSVPQFSESQNKETYKVASVRIHVERAISRLKTFGVLQFIEHSLYRHINKILIVLSYIVNNFDPLICDGSAQEEDDEEDLEEGAEDDLEEGAEDDLEEGAEEIVIEEEEEEDKDENEDEMELLEGEDHCQFDVMNMEIDDID